MDVKEIRGWFEAYAVDMGRGAWHITDDGIDKAAAEIAKLVEDEMQPIRMELESAENCYQMAEAQLAEMRAKLTRNGELSPAHFRTWADSIERELRYSKANITEWLREVAEALSAAPEVPVNQKRLTNESQAKTVDKERPIGKLCAAKIINFQLEDVRCEEEINEDEKSSKAGKGQR